MIYTKNKWVKRIRVLFYFVILGTLITWLNKHDIINNISNNIKNYSWLYPDKTTQILLIGIWLVIIYCSSGLIFNYISKLVRSIYSFGILWVHLFWGTFLVIYLSILWHNSNLSLFPCRGIFVENLLLTISIVTIIIFVLGKLTLKKIIKKVKYLPPATGPADQPIVTDEQDRAGFLVKRDEIAAYIKNNKPRTLAIIGDYGSGKTSLYNLVENRCRKTLDNTHYIRIDLHRFETFESLPYHVFDHILDDLEQLFIIPNLKIRTILSDVASSVLSGFKLDNLTNKVAPGVKYEGYLKRLSEILQFLDIHFIVLIDEFDRIEGQQSIQTILRTINLFKANAANITLVIPFASSALLDQNDTPSKDEENNGSIDSAQNRVLKYFDAHFFVPQLWEVTFSELIREISVRFLNEKLIDEKTFSKVYSEKNILENSLASIIIPSKPSQESKELKECLLSLLNTQRKVVKFEELLRLKIKKCGEFFAFSDLIILSALEVESIELIQLIDQRKEEFFSNDYFSLRSDVNNQPEEIEKIILQYFPNNKVHSVIYRLFPATQIFLKNKESIRNNDELSFANRVGHATLAKLYFDNIEDSRVTELRESFLSFKYRETILEKLLPANNQGNEIGFLFDKKNRFMLANLKWLIKDGVLKSGHTQSVIIIRNLYTLLKIESKLRSYKFQLVNDTVNSYWKICKAYYDFELNSTSNQDIRTAENRVVSFISSIILADKCSDVLIDELIASFFEQKIVQLSDENKILVFREYLTRIKRKITNDNIFLANNEFDNLLPTWFEVNSNTLANTYTINSTFKVWFLVYVYLSKNDVSHKISDSNPVSYLSEQIGLKTENFEIVFHAFTINAINDFDSVLPELIFGREKILELMAKYIQDYKVSSYPNDYFIKFRNWYDRELEKM